MFDTLSLRPACPSDDTFCRALFGAIRTEELQAHLWDAAVREHLLHMQFAAHQAHLLGAGDVLDHIVQVGADARAQPVGRRVVFRRDGELHLADIGLLPAFRRQGIGTRLLTDLQAEARAAGVVLRLFCQRTNPAERLYRRLGFVDDGGNGTHLRLAWRPDAPR